VVSKLNKQNLHTPIIVMKSKTEYYVACVTEASSWSLQLFIWLLSKFPPKVLANLRRSLFDKKLKYNIGRHFQSAPLKIVLDRHARRLLWFLMSLLIQNLDTLPVGLYCLDIYYFMLHYTCSMKYSSSAPLWLHCMLELWQTSSASTIIKLLLPHI